MKLLQDVLRALTHVHGQTHDGVTVLHRDVKPANILVDAERERGVLADFDVAKVSSAFTTMGGGAGTEPFKAPEVADASRGGVALPASDLFSFGVTMVAVLLPGIYREKMPKTTHGQ